MPKNPKIPKIFTGQPLRYATSNKTDGQASFGHVDDATTIANINRFVDKLDWPIRGYGFIGIRYKDELTYDQIAIITKRRSAPTRFKRRADGFDADAAITDQSGVILLLPTADCYPVTLYDPKQRVLALVHLGWHSTQAHLLQKVISAMQTSFKTNPADLLVHFGPGIPAKYYVHADPVQLSLPGWREHLHKTKAGYEIDLLSYNLEQLSTAGVIGQNIEFDPRNTVESDELESHYIHSKQNLPSARRFLTAVMLS